jgi:GNAT superfamily N-acetyltransferase
VAHPTPSDISNTPAAIAGRSAGSREIDVIPLRGRRDRGRFVDLPYRLHRRDPNWVPPLRRDVRQMMDPRKSPFFDHGEAQFWLAWRDGEPVGRISAQVNRLHLETHRDETGNFGMLEAIDDAAVFAALLEAAEDWLRARGMRRAIGPYSLSMNDEIGVLVAGFDTPPMVGMPHAPPYYADRLEEAGYAKVKDLHALRVAVADLVTEHLELVERVTGQLRAAGRLDQRFLDPARFADEMRLALDIYNEAWTENWGFIPVSDREAKALIDQLAPILPPQGVIFGLADGEAAAMLVALPNLNELLADLDGKLFPFGWARLLWRLRFRQPRTARIILAGVRRRYRGSAISTALVTLMLGTLLKVGQERNVETVEMSWILEDNKASLEGCLAIGGRLAKLYRIYGKNL